MNMVRFNVYLLLGQSAVVHNKGGHMSKLQQYSGCDIGCPMAKKNKEILG